MATLPKNDESLPMTRYDAPVIGRLIAMPTTPGKIQVGDLGKIAGYRNVVSFDFPSMPDVIELARSAEYIVNYNPIMPDGMHQYKGTRPLEIPLSFKLHAMDNTYCKNGSLTLLQLAARLHSFVLPITSSENPATVAPLTAGSIIDDRLAGKDRVDESKRAAELANISKEYKTAGGKGEPNESTVLSDSSTNSSAYTLSMGGKNQGADPPVTCFLNLIWVAEDQPGISCIGYVKDVRVRLLGPWLRGPNGAFNLPSAGEFEFTFVHRPSHNNNWGGIQRSDKFTAPASAETQAYATDVRNRLFNTRNLVLLANYHGFDTDGGASTGAAITTPPSGAGGGSTIPLNQSQPNMIIPPLLGPPMPIVWP